LALTVKRTLLLLVVACGCLRLGAVDVDKTEEGSPFGSVSDADVANLMAFAKTKGVDLSKGLELASKNDDGALSRAFLFSLKFRTLDDNARTYGQIIWSNLLNMAEGRGTDWYSGLVARQPRKVQQRIRDFLHYATFKEDPLHERNLTDAERAEWQKLFPKGYSFGANDPIFSGQAEQLPAPMPPPGSQPSAQAAPHR
jgi:hypothetical protein